MSSIFEALSTPEKQLYLEFAEPSRANGLCWSLIAEAMNDAIQIRGLSVQHFSASDIQCIYDQRWNEAHLQPGMGGTSHQNQMMPDPRSQTDSQRQGEIPTVRENHPSYGKRLSEQLPYCGALPIEHAEAPPSWLPPTINEPPAASQQRPAMPRQVVEELRITAQTTGLQNQQNLTYQDCLPSGPPRHFELYLDPNWIPPYIRD